MTEDLNYKDAIEELETILEEIESDDVDVDVLAAKVERASALIVLCRSKIEKTEAKVTEILQTLDES